MISVVRVTGLKESRTPYEVPGPGLAHMQACEFESQEHLCPWTCRCLMLA